MGAKSGVKVATMDQGLTAILKSIGLPPGHIAPLLVSIFCAYILESIFPIPVDVPAALLAVFSGYIVWIVYRRLIGEYFLYPLFQSTHFFIDRRTKHNHSTFSYLSELGVTQGMRRKAYNFIRNEIIFGQDEKLFRKLSRAHTDAHVFYLLFLYSGLAIANMIIISDFRHGLFSLAIFSISFFISFVIDAQQHAVDVQCFREIDTQNLREKLIQAKFIKGENTD